MSLSATARSVRGTLRQELLVGGRHRLATDQPERLGGADSAPSPHELLPAALAACIAYTLVRYSRTKGWALGDVTVEVEYDHESTPRRVATSIDVTGDLGEQQLKRLEKVAAACPLRRSLEAGFEFVETVVGGRVERVR